MTKNKKIILKVLVIIGCLAAIAAFMYLEHIKYDIKSHYIDSATQIYRAFGSRHSATSGDPMITVITYCIAGVFGVVMYFFTTLVPRTYEIQGTSKKVYRAVAGVFIFCFGVHMLMSKAEIYRLIIPKCGIVGTVQNKVYNYLPAVNVALAFIVVAVCILCAEIPAAIKWRKEIFKPRAMSKTAQRFAVCTLITLVGLIICTAMLGMLNHFNPDAIKRFERSFRRDNSNVVRFVTMAVCAPLFEEIAFRGMMLGKLKKHMPVWCALGISALCFGIWHGNLAQFVYTTAMGVEFGLVYLLSGRLRYSMYVHALNNAIATVSMSVTGDGILPRMLPLYNFRKDLMNIGFVPALLIFLGAAAVTAGLFILLRRVGAVEDRSLRGLKQST